MNGSDVYDVGTATTELIKTTPFEKYRIIELIEPVEENIFLINTISIYKVKKLKESYKAFVKEDFRSKLDYCLANLIMDWMLNFRPRLKSKIRFSGDPGIRMFRNIGATQILPIKV